MLLGVIAYNRGNLLRRLVLPFAISSWSLTSLQGSGRSRPAGASSAMSANFILQLAESPLTPTPFRQILGRIERFAGHPT